MSSAGGLCPCTGCRRVRACMFSMGPWSATCTAPLWPDRSTGSRDADAAADRRDQRACAADPKSQMPLHRWGIASSRALSIRHSDIFRRSGGMAPRGSCGAASSAGSRHMTRALGGAGDRGPMSVGPPEASRPGGSKSYSVRLEVDVRDSGWPPMSVSASEFMPAAVPAGNACIPFHR